MKTKRIGYWAQKLISLSAISRIGVPWLPAELILSDLSLTLILIAKSDFLIS